MESSRFEFYKEVYKEIDRRNSLNTEIALQGTVLVAVISGIFFLVPTLKSDSVLLNRLFTGLVVLETWAAVGTGYYLARSYYDFTKGGRIFGYLP